MKLSRLKELVQHYDNNKGWRRKIFGDASPIRALKELIHQTEDERRENTDIDISYSRYQTFVNDRNYAVDLSDNYLNQNSISSRMIAEWKEEEFRSITSAAPIILTPPPAITWASIAIQFSALQSLPEIPTVPRVEIVNPPINIHDFVQTMPHPDFSRFLNALNTSLPSYDRFSSFTFFSTARPHSPRQQPPPQNNFEAQQSEDITTNMPRSAPAA